MSAGSRLLMLGLQGSGKTSFLAALWHLVEAAELPASLTAPTLQPNREYLNRIRDNWLRFQEVGRTPLRVDESFSLILRDSITNGLIDVSIPDLSGESLRLQWALRKATVGFADRCQTAVGAFLFIHPESVRRPLRIPPNEAPAPVNGPDGRTNMMSQSNTQPNDDPQLATHWTAEAAPTQVQLVELLQFASYLRHPEIAFRISVVISAWDLIRTPIVPIAWLERRLPLLFQFLTANSDVVPFRVFGVSALGGNLEADRELLQRERVPSRRIRVVDDAVESHHDLTAPLRFLLDLDNVKVNKGATESTHDSEKRVT